MNVKLYSVLVEDSNNKILMEGLISKLLTLYLLFGVTYSQRQGTFTEEYHLPFTVSVCDVNGCVAEESFMVLSGDSHWLHVADTQAPCLIDGKWNLTVCPDPLTCAQNCALDGIDEQSWKEYGITQWENGIRINFLTESSSGRHIGGGGYIMAPDDTLYRMFMLKNREFTFDIDTSKIGCGLNGAVYFVEMKEDGGLSSEEGNSAGAKYGTGYCDAQCSDYMNWIGGIANTKSEEDGFDKNGACCFEMDIWEANSQANSFTIHNCNIEGAYVCQEDCDKCDKIGCETNAYRLKNLDYYGTGTEFTIDSSRPFTIVTQFITSDGTDDGELVEIKRKYVQDGQIFENPNAKLEGLEAYSSETDDFCRDVENVYGQYDYMNEMGGMKAMGEALDRGMVLSISLWEDHNSYMLWLDSVFPEGTNPDDPGATRGPCPTDSGRPEDLEVNAADSYVAFYNFRVGEINTTF